MAYISLICVLIILIMQLMGVLNSYSYIDEELVGLLFLVPATFYILSELAGHVENNFGSRYEYREYLVKELERNELHDIGKDGLEKSEDEEISPKVEPIIVDNNDAVNYELKKSDKRDILALMLKNNDEITDYFRISKSQARSSFWFSVISCLAGMVALGFGIYGVC